ncbi:MAG: hypothetical protein V3S20_02765 [Dehalococcoidia bacterium]
MSDGTATKGDPMLTVKRSSFWFNACIRCGGDAYFDLSDEPEWRCLQCGRVVPVESTTAHAIQAEAGRRAA